MSIAVFVFLEALVEVGVGVGVEEPELSERRNRFGFDLVGFDAVLDVDFPFCG